LHQLRQLSQKQATQAYKTSIWLRLQLSSLFSTSGDVTLDDEAYLQSGDAEQARVQHFKVNTETFWERNDFLLVLHSTIQC